MAGLLMKFRGDINLAVAAYNAGPMAVEKHKGMLDRMLRLKPTFNELIYCINGTRASVSWLLKYPASERDRLLDLFDFQILEFCILKFHRFSSPFSRV